MNDIYDDNPDLDKMSTEELYKWTFSKRPESLPHKKGIFELNKRYYDMNIKTSQKTRNLTKWPQTSSPGPKPMLAITC